MAGKAKQKIRIALRGSTRLTSDTKNVCSERRDFEQGKLTGSSRDEKFD